MSTDTLTPTAPTGQDRRRPSGPPNGVRKALKYARPYLLGSLAVVLVIVVWELVVAGGLVNSVFLPRPLDVARALGTLFTGGSIWSNLAVSGEEFGIGLGISIVVGSALGVLTGWYKALDEFLKPIVIAVNGVPHVALVPVLILIYGIGVTSKVAVVILGCLTVMLMNTATGVANVDPQLKRMSRSFTASDRQTLMTVVLPSIVPYFMSGVRISIGRAIVGVVVGEIFAAKRGIGNMLSLAADSFNMSVMYAALIVLTVIAILLTQCAGWLERRLQRWRE